MLATHVDPKRWLGGEKQSREMRATNFRPFVWKCRIKQDRIGMRSDTHRPPIGQGHIWPRRHRILARRTIRPKIRTPLGSSVIDEFSPLTTRHPRIRGETMPSFRMPSALRLMSSIRVRFGMVSPPFSILPMNSRAKSLGMTIGLGFAL